MGAFAQSWLVSPGISPAFSFEIGSGILFVSLEKVFILALEGTRFPSLLTPQTQQLSLSLSREPYELLSNFIIIFLYFSYI